MSMKYLESYLQKLNPELYRFAYALVPDDLQAEQLVIDALNALIIEGVVDITAYKEDEQNTAHAIRIGLYRHTYSLARRRFPQLKGSLDIPVEMRPFYGLDFDSRGILFLKHHTDLSFDEMEEVINLFKHQIIATVYSAREQLFALSGQVFEQREL